MVADNFYGEDRGLKRGLRELKVPYVMALKPSHAWYHPEEVAGTLQDVAKEAGWVSSEQPGQWVRITRTFRDGSIQDWWALEIVSGPYGPDKKERAIVASTDPKTLPDLSTWYLVTNLPAPDECQEGEPQFPPASLEEVLRLYGLRMWVEQSYKHVKHALGWSQYQVRSDTAIRRHWQLVCCAFSFCWYHASGQSKSKLTVHVGKILTASSQRVHLSHHWPGCTVAVKTSNSPVRVSSQKGWKAPGVLVRPWKSPIHQVPCKPPFGAP